MYDVSVANVFVVLLNYILNYIALLSNKQIQNKFLRRILIYHGGSYFECVFVRR